jgi:hypothetical protein
MPVQAALGGIGSTVGTKHPLAESPEGRVGPAAVVRTVVVARGIALADGDLCLARGCPQATSPVDETKRNMAKPP